MVLSVGIWIVGSLLWDEHPTRKQWRQDRLDLARAIPIATPIRYGRCSSSRRNSYTMVFSEALSRDGGKMGQAIVVPCQRAIRTIDDLIEEAECLWGAEMKSASSNRRISADWGCVALAVNPKAAVPEHLLQGWSNRVAREGKYGDLIHAEDEAAVVSSVGRLMLPWPLQKDGSPLKLDAILATATNPTLIDGRYPMAQEVADGWVRCADRTRVQYFWENRAHGIVTFQDDEIESTLCGEKSNEG